MRLLGFVLRCRCHGRFAVRRLLLWIALTLFVTLVMYSLFNFKSRCRYEMPTMLGDPVFSHSDSSRCHLDLDSLGVVPVNVHNMLTMQQVESRHESVVHGGQWKPTLCSSWQKLAIIIAYRDRYNHLVLLLDRLHEILQTQLIDYQIFVIEQVGQGVFNKGRLYNTGVTEALKHDSFTCFVFHDVDLLPEHNGNIYYCDQHVRHLSSAVDEMRYHTMYYNLIGGVISISQENFYRANGYSNVYWGWGNEDDDFSVRTEALNLMITRPPEHIGRFKMVPHPKRPRAGTNYDLFLTWRSRWKSDGLSSLDESGSKVLALNEHRLYTNISVDVGRAPLRKPDVSQVPHESLFWFLNFFFP